MTDSIDTVALTRPGADPEPGPLDDRFLDLVEARVRRMVRDTPVIGTYLGLHSEDHRLGDGSREAVLDAIERDRVHLAAVESLDPSGLSAHARFERDLEIHNVRLALFDASEVRRWERRSSATEEIGDAIFLLFARDFAPLPERLASIAGRLEEVPTFLEASHSRLTGTPVTAWQRIEQGAARQLPALFAEIQRSAHGVLSGAELRRLEQAITGASAALERHAEWVATTLDRATDDWALGDDLYGELVARRAFDGLDADAILEIGWEQLRKNREGRRACARELDPDAEEAAVIDRLKSDHPATFAEALEAYRGVMHRARAHLVERDLVTVPDDETIHVIETPLHLRNVIPFAAYVPPAKFDPDPTGVYIVTPSVGDDPRAMREHNWAAISNTSIHEAYPGHHLQLAVAAKHPSLTRLQCNAPEFVEGWGMYSEQMMREEGFDDGPAFRMNMYTDAIWRACRIILDVRMHRGELTSEEAVDFLVEHTGFERSNARAEVQWYTYRPTYPLSYLLGRTLLLQLRADEQRRLGDAFSLKGFHDALLRNGSLPISFHRRLLAGEGR
jgi:uncharacterized protein (DUF885 family)